MVSLEALPSAQQPQNRLSWAPQALPLASLPIVACRAVARLGLARFSPLDPNLAAREGSFYVRHSQGAEPENT